MVKRGGVHEKDGRLCSDRVVFSFVYSGGSCDPGIDQSAFLWSGRSAAVQPHRMDRLGRAVSVPAADRLDPVSLDLSSAVQTLAGDVGGLPAKTVMTEIFHEEMSEHST